MKKIAGYISPLQKFLASPPQNEIRAARPAWLSNRLVKKIRHCIIPKYNYSKSSRRTSCHTNKYVQ